ncbi:hypothetical protein ABID08_000734 [Rhizobium binae]|uniref:Uncharacterized protein n=1 Tax=Rhizobium binae TaxID=1138190 RepID=A0ABV2MA90_9HYPH|nr:hypothetical protein [Rhizobium binae]MBX4992303.1 hypothetical protein [Rhizobium binae]NKL52780.1 hypothetical protein [Rhizobium leguminosarum bv. viciae]QSY80731.1 hypothetical protein J2J99_13495 [Rhizobium binae]
MATELLAVGSTAANSADLVVASGSTVLIGIKGATTAQARVRITVKDDAGGYTDVGELTPFRPAIAITAPGTYRFSRVAGEMCGVFSA